MNKKLLCQLISDLTESGKLEQAEEVQNLMDYCELLFDSVYRIERIKEILGIVNESD